jgi:hypothetical protein
MGSHSAAQLTFPELIFGVSLLLTRRTLPAILAPEPGTAQLRNDRNRLVESLIARKVRHSLAMLKLPSRLVSLVLLVGLAILLTPVAVASAHAGPPPQKVVPYVDLSSCTGAPSAANCNGIDPSFVYPNGSSCASDGQTIASFAVKEIASGNTVAYNELRWSAKCKTNWVRMTAAATFPYPMTAKIYNYCSPSPNYGNPNYRADTIETTTQGDVIWTPMIYAPNNSVTMYGFALGSPVSHCY